MCMVDDADFADFCSSENRRAAKAHRCAECARVIVKGETYEHFVSLYDSKWWTVKVCMHCCHMRLWLDRVCGGFLYTRVLEELYDHWHEGYKSFEFGKLITRMQRGWNGGRDELPLRVEEIAAEMMASEVA